MKAIEYRGLPVEELNGLLAEAQQNLIELRFKKGVRQLENQTGLKDTRREIALLKTLIREEQIKVELEKAQSILDGLKKDHEFGSLDLSLGDGQIYSKKAKLQKIVSSLYQDSQRDKFRKELKQLKRILLNKRTDS